MNVVLEPEGTPVGDFQRFRTSALSEMLDNMGQSGIYPTTRFYARLDDHFRSALRNARERAIQRLVRYIQHDPSCAQLKQHWFREPRRCDCGVYDALAELRR